jgi:hypothetical protein
MHKITTAIQNAPENAYQITQLVEELQAEHVLPPQEYLQLISEKKLVQALYLFLIKQEGNKMQEELTVAQQLDALLTGPTLRPTQELVDILAAYKPITAQPLVWSNLKTLIERYQGVVIDFEIREIAKRKFCKQEKFLSIVERAVEVDFAALSE